MLIDGDGCGDDFMDIERVKTLTNQIVTSFLAKQLGWQSASKQYLDIEASDIAWQTER